MTSRTESFPSEYVAVPRFAWGRLGFTFALTLSAVILFSAAFAVGYGRLNAGRILPGVDVAGVDLAGLDRSAAEAKLRTTLPNLSAGAITLTVAGQTETIPYADISRQYQFDPMLDQAFSLGQGASFLEQLQEQLAILANGVSVQPQMGWDNDVLATRIAAVAAAAQTAPVDATLARVNGRYVVTPSQDGLSVELAPIVTQAMAAVDNLSPASAQITVAGVPLIARVTTTDAQAAADRVESVVAETLALSAGQLSLDIEPDVIRGWVYLHEVALGDWQLEIAAEPIAQYLAAFAARTDTPATNATFGFEGGKAKVIPSAMGQALDVDATTSSVLGALQARAAGQPPGNVQLSLVAVNPEFTTDQAEALASQVTMIGTWTTHYIPQASNGGGVNIRIPTDTINGFVVQPGEQFDFLTAIGPIKSPPYVEGGVLIHGQIKEDGAIGGGMCSCSTTLFNAALRAGLEIDKRSNHSIYISRYPVGLDATVWMSGGTRRTMAFTNDTGYPVLVKGINHKRKVTFELYGIDDGRTVEVKEPRIENRIEAGKWLKYTNDLPAGERRKDQDGYDKFDSWVTVIVRDKQGNVMHEYTFFSRYKKLDAITLVGRYPGDPPAGTLVRPENYRPGSSTPPPNPNPPKPDPSKPDPKPDPPGQKPSASFTVKVKNLKATFTDKSTGAETWTWDFGDGTTSADRSPKHTYAAAGTYKVKLTVTNANGKSKSTATVTVKGKATPPPDDGEPDPGEEPPPGDG